MKTPIINHENANVELPKNRFKAGDIVRSIGDLKRRGIIGRSVIGIVLDNANNSDSIYEVQFQAYPDTSLVWDFQIEKLDNQE